MQYFFQIILSLTFLISCAGHRKAEMPAQTLSPEERYWDDFDNDIQGRTLKIFNKQQKIKHIQGVCIIKDEKNFFDDYCQGVQLILVDQNKQVAGTTKTDAAGIFKFSNVPMGTYQLRVDDKRYTKVAKFIFVSAGAEVLIHLKPVEK